MLDKDLKKLSREEVLEIMMQVSKENTRLQSELEELEKKLTNRDLEITECGSLAEACLRVNQVFAKADNAVDQFLINFKNHCIEEDLNEISSDILKTAKEESENILIEAKRKAEAILAEARIQAERERSQKSLFRRNKEASRVSGKDLRTASRDEILELLYETVKEKDELAEKNSDLEAKLNAREIAIKESGSLSEAAIKIQGIMEAADAAAKQYLDNVKKV